MYYDYEPGEWITYHFFYPYNLWDYFLTPQEVHESDWEKIALQLDSFDNAIGIAAYQHDCNPQDVYAADDWLVANPHPGDFRYVSWEGTHPVIFSALGGHASYYEAGTEVFPCISPYDTTGEGAYWETWRSLEPAQEQPWFGFGGAWGWGKTGSTFQAWGATGSGRSDRGNPYFALPEGW